MSPPDAHSSHPPPSHVVSPSPDRAVWMTKLAELELAPKLSQGFINAAAKILFHKDVTITAEFVHENIFAESKVTVAEVGPLLDEAKSILLTAAKQAWGLQELAAHLTSIGIAGDDKQAPWLKVWKTEQAGAHATVVQGTVWNHSFTGVNWRVDLLSAGNSSASAASGASSSAAAAAAGAGAGASKPVALVQLHSAAPEGAGAAPKSILFEMSAEQVKGMTAEFNKIQTKIEQRSS